MFLFGCNIIVDLFLEAILQIMYIRNHLQFVCLERAIDNWSIAWTEVR